ncbi:MAG: DUF4097 family beta strand repeat protein [Calditrichaeota bacterium]|nr:DUF4097 family beta strand repeat protein [Calditrichota bacterium]HQU72662.1 hypothetical protein [Calditrichia bacterium]
MVPRNFTSTPWLVLLLTALLVLPALSQDEELQEVIDKTFEVRAGGKLYIDSDRGSIEVRSRNTDQLSVRVVRRPQAWSEEDELEMLRNFRIKFEQSGNTVSITGTNLQRRSGNWWNNKKMKVEFEVTVPEEFNLDLRTAGGSIEVGDIRGDVEITTAGGSLRLGHISGKTYAKTAGGSISLAGGDGDAMLKTAGGSINVGKVKGNVDANTAGGSITIDGAGGNVDAHTSGGSIKVMEVLGDINAKTSGGSVLAYIYGQPRGNCSLGTSGGSVTVYLGENVGVDLNARANGNGRIKSDFAVKGEIRKSRISGQINGGGPILNLHTSSGTINILKAERG